MRYWANLKYFALSVLGKRQLPYKANWSDFAKLGNFNIKETSTLKTALRTVQPLLSENLGKVSYSQSCLVLMKKSVTDILYFNYINAFELCFETWFYYLFSTTAILFDWIKFNTWNYTKSLSCYSCGTVQQALAAIFVSSRNAPPPLLGKNVAWRDKTRLQGRLAQHGSNTTFQPLFH